MGKKDDLLNKMDGRFNNIVDKKGRLYFDVEPDDIRDIARYLFEDVGCRLSTATAQERYGWVEVQYHFSHDETGHYFCPRVVMKDKKNPVSNSIAGIVKGAEWIEREMMEFWGITFRDHPRPEPLLTRDHPRQEERKNQLRFNGAKNG